MQATTLMNFSFETIWSDIDRSRFFLIPNDRQLPVGDFELRTVTGRKQQVEESAIIEFEISRDEAKIWLKEQFGEVLSSAKTGIIDALKNWRSPSSSSNSETDPATPKSRTETALSELEDLLNQSSEQMQAKSVNSLEYLKAIAQALNAMFEGAISSDADGLERAEEQAQILRDNLEALGIKTGTQLETFPKRLHSLYFAERQTKNFQENADQLEAIASQIEQTSKLAVQAIRAMARQQRKHATQSKLEGDRQM